ncbi:uncharacterized protein LOC132307737 isoform X1 [Cornus florida]|uniref:uncharacterized protein LOC132307737 isoform X1 n=1 Tax=Cornus florida TaxID=4283 RepID=UPI0028A28A2B|nr:uncharacterized protein LOC132307737 isoform X1 [Cornus florida]
MAKNRNKKRNALASMDITSDQTIVDLQAMDTSESVAANTTLSASNSSLKKHEVKIKRGVQMKRSKNVRKMKAIAKAISQNEKSSERISKNESKTARTQSAKKLYD